MENVSSVLCPKISTRIRTAYRNRVVDRAIKKHFASPDRISQLNRLHEEFARTGYAEIADIFPAPLQEELHRSLHQAFDVHGVERNFKNPTSQTHRRYHSLSRRLVQEHVPVAAPIYASKTFLKIVSRVIGENAERIPKRWKDDRFVAHRADQAGNEHGAHVDPFPIAAVYISKAPPAGAGGVLQFVDVPKDAPPVEASDVPKMLDGRYPIQTRSPQTNSLYLLSALKKPHYTTPLNHALDKKSARLNITYGFTVKSDLRTPEQIDKIFEEEVMVSYPENFDSLSAKASS